LLFGAFYSKNRIKSGKTGFEMAITAVPEPVFSFPAPKTARKCWCTFYVSLLCKVLDNRLQGGI